MEAQTLQQQVPVYHVCQECNGAGCQACSDLLILEGDVELDPYECPYCGWIGGHVDGCVFVDPEIDQQLEWLDAFSERVQLLTKMAPINGVIGTTPDYPFSTEARLASVNKLVARMPYRSVRSEDGRSYFEACGL
ncbi:hypothetical protein [Aeromonas veronii]|uniref:hypothetical protein n=1 Tax=Aeromonas veronii TaxID=654 RepID=UPI001F235961|nr:hypothetical protein [Aeromonas veronii]MCF5866480.1 hypothetical protein [Aeromonas veronii]